MRPSEAAARFDARASTYDLSESHRWEAGVVDRFLGPGDLGDVLDVATGTALVLRHIRDRCRTLAGVDVSAGMLAEARRHLPTADLRVADAADLPFPSGAFDRVLCVSALPYLDDPGAARSEWARVVREDGRIVVTSPTADGLTAPRRFRRAAAIHGVDIPDPNERTGSVAALERLGAAHGLRVTRSTTSSFSSRGRSSGEEYEAMLRMGFVRGAARSAAIRTTFDELMTGVDATEHRILIVELAPR